MKGEKEEGKIKGKQGNQKKSEGMKYKKKYFVFLVFCLKNDQTFKVAVISFIFGLCYVLY